MKIVILLIKHNHSFINNYVDTIMEKTLLISHEKVYKEEVDITVDS